MTELLYKELSYKITGLIFEIDNKIGYGHDEKTYGDALQKLLEKDKIPFDREVYFPIKIDGKLLTKVYFDFLIENKIIVELKVSDRNYKKVCSQLFKYLKSSGLKLGLIYRFTSGGVRTKRIPNYY